MDKESLKELFPNKEAYIEQNYKSLGKPIFEDLNDQFVKQLHLESF